MPICTIYVNGTADENAVPECEEVTTGRYRVTFEMPSVCPGDVIMLHVFGTMHGIDTQSAIDQYHVVGEELQW